MKFSIILVTLCSIVSAASINQRPADVHAAASGDKFSNELWKMNLQYKAKVEAIDKNDNSKAYEKFNKLPLKCNFLSAIQLVGTSITDSGKSNAIQKLQSNYQVDLKNLEDKYNVKNVQVCNR